jgi:hypothetical protein
MQFTLSRRISITEPDVIEGKPVIKTRQRLVDLVDGRILGFKALLG